MALNGAVNFKLPRVVSINGAPNKIKIKLGKKVKNVTTVAAIKADMNKAFCPNTWLVQPLTKPTKVTTMINGPGVVSPKARASII